MYVPVYTCTGTGEEVQLQKHELHKQLHKHMEVPRVYVIVYVTHEFKVP